MTSFFRTLKKFYKWLKKLPDNQEPAETSWIKTGCQAVLVVYFGLYAMDCMSNGFVN